MATPHYDPTLGTPESEILLAIAADVVANLAPPPDPETLAYSDQASNAEYLILNWLTSTKGGALTGKSLSGVSSKSFSQMAVVQSIVAASMPEYFTGGSAGAIGIVRESFY